MIKKLMVVFICFIVLIFSCDKVEAAVDYSLNYEVTKFNLSNNVLTVDGWAFIHHLDSKGAKIQVYLYNNSSGHRIYATVTQSSYDLTAWMKLGSQSCASRKIYNDDVGFHAVFNTNKLDNDGQYSLGITVTNGTLVKATTKVAVAKQVANIDASSYFDISDVSEKVDTSVYMGYLQKISNGIASQANGYYFSQTTQTSADDKFTITGVTKAKRNYNNDCGDAYSEISFYALRGKILSNQYCGFYGQRTVCFVSSNANDATTYYAPGSWVVLSGNVSVKLVCDPNDPNSPGYPCTTPPPTPDPDPEPEPDPEVTDKVCSVNNDSLDKCSSDVFRNNCSGMKIRTETDDGTVLSAIVSINEKGEFRNKVSSDIVVIAGRSLAFELKYIYNLSWNFSNYICNGVAESECKRLLYEKVLMSDDYFGKANANTLVSRLNMNGVVQADGYTFAKDVNLKYAGAWTCNSSDTLRDGYLTISCDYKINDAYINYYTNYITYEDKSGEVNIYQNLGPYFYLPLNYSEDDFKWNVSTSNLSLIKVRTVKNDYTSTSSNSWVVDTTGNNSNKCSVKVLDNNLITIPNSPDDDSDLVYRSVDISVKEDDLSLYYLTEGTNWYKYFYGNSNVLNTSRLARINSSLSNSSKHYTSMLLTKQKINDLLESYDTKDYMNWNNISIYGMSSLVRDPEYITILKNTSNIHCEWGKFGDSCDKYN